MFTIGQFSRATHLSVKALRHYDDLGLLVPAAVDPASGYRRYQAAQTPAAHLISGCGIWRCR
jgi:DNA-binding transcriptional MerR regulator